jgi:transcriptional regulator of acetoin/glycerol metabolism
LFHALDAHRQPAAFVDGGGALRHANLALRIACPDATTIRDVIGLPWEEFARLQADQCAARRSSGLLGRTVDIRWVLDTNGQRIAAVLTARDAVARSEAPAPSPQAAPSPFDVLDGTDAALRATVRRAARLARAPLALLLLAETGTGKDVLARAIHEASPRSSGPFVAVNCGAFTPSLLQSELFGYGPGAFTGAVRNGRAGFVEVASGGTLFLDEVADLTPEAQSALLRFLEDGSFYRVGETTTRLADVRVVSATSRDLTSLVRSGAFRDDLLYRLRGSTLSLPPLRARDDLSTLIDLMLARAIETLDCGPLRLSASASAALLAYPWPGNFRELHQAILAAAAVAEGPWLERSDLPDHVLASGAPERMPPSRPSEADAIDAALASANGNVSEAARQLGVARSTIYRRQRRRQDSP